MAEIDSGRMPFSCLDQTPGIECEGCPFVTQAAGCVALKAGKTILSQRAEIARLTQENDSHEQENALLLERLFNIRLDTLVGTAFTPEGLRDHLQHDVEMQREMQELQWGVVRLDGRFVNYINRFGNRIGDIFLKSGGKQITAIADGLARTHQRRVQATLTTEQRTVHRRQGHSLEADIICREGGDEFALLIRNVSPAQLASVAGRIQAPLTVAQTQERYAQGKIPFIASVGYTHASEYGPEVISNLSEGRYWEGFKIVNDEADASQHRTKINQYREMWEIAVRAMPDDPHPPHVAQPDDRTVAEEFLRWVCPDFMDNPITFLMREGAHE